MGLFSDEDQGAAIYGFFLKQTTFISKAQKKTW